MTQSIHGIEGTECATVLLVDDRHENLVTLQAVLERSDYVFVLAHSGDEALMAVLKYDVAVVLLDVAMPALDGFQTASLIRQRPAALHIPIIFVTGVMADIEHVFRGYQAGAVDYLTKPFDPNAVRAKVAAFVELWRHRRTIERTCAALHEVEHRERMALEALYQVTFEEAPIGIGHIDLQGRWLRVNPRLGEILGRPIAQLVRCPLRDQLLPGDGDRFDADVRGVIDGTRSRVHGEYRFLRPAGATVWVALTLSLIRDTEGRPVQLALMEDVTEEKRLAAALAASERRLAQLAEMGFIGVFEETREGRIEAANSAFLAMIGRSAGEVLAGRVSAHEHTPAECEAAEEQAWKALATTGVCKTYEREYVRKDGRRITALVGGIGNDTRFVGCALDVTALKEVARERARVVRELEDSVRARDDFLSLAAHELRGPLTPLMLRLDGLLNRTERNAVSTLDVESFAEELRAMKRVASRVTQLVDNLLEASRMTVGRIPLEIEDVDLSTVVREVVDRMRPQLARAECQLTLKASDGVVGRWDRARIDQIVSNLLSNAIKYGAHAPIEIEVASTGEVGSVEIRDHGIGIPREQQERIFERFERAAPVRHYGGFGIGLWIVRKLVEAHGGTVQVESVPGVGSRFTVELPRAGAPATVAPAGAARS
ncbi:MAG TPA: ATP-binding protein [Polyangiaceae bacterium]